MSADFREHAVAHFLLPILEHHDKATFEVYCYSSWPWADTTTERIRSCADHWVPCKDLSDDQLAERIRADGIDILVDLSGHTAENRLLTFARKPAPVQITYLGYPGTSGLSAMDYRITDALADPAGSDAFYTEKLIRLPDSLCCYRPAHHMPDVAPLPALHNGFVTFGSLNGFAKVNDDCLRVWAEILKAVPASRLLMLTVPEGLARERLVEKFAALGIPAGRLDLFGKFPSGEFYKMFQRVDIALDPFPVTGGTTTCETLWMGVPVIVLAGQRFVSRVGYSFLSAAGLGHLSTASIDDYIRTAVNLAADIPALAKLHDRLRPQVAASPLTNAAAFTRNLEAAFRHTWKNWCASQSDDAVPETARQTEEEMQRSLQLALGHHQAGRLAEAEAGYRAILQVAPHHPDALHFLGVLARQQGQPALAVELISKVVAALPSHAEAHFNLGNALNDQGLFDQAIDRYRDAIRLKPDYVKAHNNLGNVLKQLGRLTEATASFEQALALRPDFAEARNNLFALRHRPAGTA